MTFPLPGVPATQLLIDWITGLGWNGAQEVGYPLFPGTYIPPEPDRAVFVAATGGPGFVTEEGSVDAWTFQARVRGAPSDPLGPELAAQQLDALIFNAPFPSQVDGVTISHVHRAAGPPAPLPVDPDDLRHEFTCSYLVMSGE